MNDINKELAEWAGFIEMKDNYKGDRYTVGWEYPDDSELGKLPNFTEDLTACFAWLVPKLYEQDYYYELMQWNSGQHKAIINKKTVEWAVTASDAIAETASLALCKAIIKLLEANNEVSKVS